jgi:hypothetical protein
MIETIRQGLKADGIHVPISKLCQWFAVPRRTVYYQPTKATSKVDAKFAEPIKTMIERTRLFVIEIRTTAPIDFDGRFGALWSTASGRVLPGGLNQ